jgi:hypothetical protein
MSELGEIHEKINSIAIDVAYLKGGLDEIKPRIITKDTVRMLISQHSKSCSIIPPAQNKKQLAKQGGLIAVLCATIIGLLEIVKLMIAG